MKVPVVAIIGRPNVGKSTFFNRLVGHRLAVVDDSPGITRDRLVAEADWNGRTFHIVDTGGWVPEARERMDEAILQQVLQAVVACDLVLFLVDARAGVHPHDRVIAQELRKRDLPVLLVANKTDHPALDYEVTEFLSLGFEPVHPVSATEGRGLGDLLDIVIERTFGESPRDPLDETPPEADVPRVAIVGRPNVGKSSITNRLLGEERMIVDERPGTTRDSVNSDVRYHGRTLTLIDTAGIRRKLGSQPRFEFYATLRAMRALDKADVAVLVLDASEPINRQDLRIASMIERAWTGVVLVINKWDLPEKDNHTMDRWRQDVSRQLPFFAHAPTLFLSALTAQRIHKLPEAMTQVYDTMQREISTSEWNSVLAKAVEHNPPRSRGGGQRPVKIYYATQVKTGPPTVVLFVSDPERMASDYLRYLTSQFREAFALEGVPVRLVLRKS